MGGRDARQRSTPFWSTQSKLDECLGVNIRSNKTAQLEEAGIEMSLLTDASSFQPSVIGTGKVGSWLIIGEASGCFPAEHHQVSRCAENRRQAYFDPDRWDRTRRAG
jgi:hypothetical protein